MEEKMIGLELSALTHTLKKVKSEHCKKPCLAIPDVEGKLAHWMPQILEQYGENYFDFFKHYNQLPLSALTGFSFDEICKLRYSSTVMMEKSVEDLFECDPEFELVRKIESSMWRWGSNKGSWNEIVELQSRVRSFTFNDDPRIEIRLDYTRDHCAYSDAKYSGLYLDGVFAYLVYYRGNHGMTIGFTLLGGRQILIQQIQSAARTGNRFLYKIPENRVEFVIEIFRRNFPGYELFLVAGESLTNKSLADYREHLALLEMRTCAYQQELDQKKGDTDTVTRALELTKKEADKLRAKVDHLKGDQPRLVSLYKNTGRFPLLNEAFSNFRLTHHRIAC